MNISITTQFPCGPLQSFLLPLTAVPHLSPDKHCSPFCYCSIIIQYICLHGFLRNILRSMFIWRSRLHWISVVHFFLLTSVPLYEYIEFVYPFICWVFGFFTVSYKGSHEHSSVCMDICFHFSGKHLGVEWLVHTRQRHI